MKIKNSKGFTLIELLIVVAIIAILAAIAIPQFAAYRMRAFNSAALSDLRNCKTAEESLFEDNQTYGRTEGAVPGGSLTGAATNGTGLGVAQPGAVPAASGVVAGAMVSGPRASDGLAVAQGTGVSNGVTLTATSAGPVAPSPASSTYWVAAKHLQGDRVFASETETTAVMFVQNDLTAVFIGIALTNAGAPATIPGAATLGLDITGPGGGNPIANWAAL